MRQIRKYVALFLMVVFCTYYAGISMFSHTHIANGSSIVHSHLGGGKAHDHSDSQYTVIDILSSFQSETAVTFYSAGFPFGYLSEYCRIPEILVYTAQEYRPNEHRGPPQC